MRFHLSSLPLVLILAASSAHAFSCPTGIDNLQKESDAMCSRFGNDSTRPTLDEANEMIACLQPIAKDTSESNHARAVAFMEMSGLQGFILKYNMGGADAYGTPSWNNVKEAMSLEKSEVDYIAWANGIMGLRKKNAFEKHFIQSHLNMNLDNEKAECIQGMESINLSPAGQVVLQNLKNS